MKILMVGTSDISGGAARATFRIHKALLEKGVDSKMLVVKKDSDDSNVVDMYGKWSSIVFFFRSRLDTIFWRFYKNKTKTLFSPSLIPFSGVSRRINKIDPDIVVLNWVCGGMMSIREISKIKAPVLWTIYDMWAFTGGCHYDEDCGGYKKKCGKCKVLKSDKKNDLSRFILKSKKRHFSKKPSINILGHSRWLSDCAKDSSLFKNNDIFNLPSLVDSRVFNCFNKNTAKSILNINSKNKIITFGAINPLGDPRKGFSQLSESLNSLENKNYELLIFGASKPKKQHSFNGLKSEYVGFLNDDVSLNVLYNASNVVVFPSIQENFSNVILESLSCGTPVVAFDIGGNRDMIEHKKNGYLAKPFDPADLARGIEWVLNNDSYEELCRNAREKVLREFDPSVVADKYIKLYKDILNKNKDEK